MGRALLVTATFGERGELNGVSNCYRSILPGLRALTGGADIVTWGLRDGVRTEGRVRIITLKPRLAVPLDDHMSSGAELLFDTVAPTTKLARYLVSRKYGLVHSASPDSLGLLGATAARRSDCPLVTVYHTCMEDYAQMRVDSWVGKRGSLVGRISHHLMRRWMAYYYAKSDLVLVPSRHTKEKVSAYFPRGDVEIAVWGRGVDIERFNPRHRDRTDDEFQAIYVGRVEPEKSVDTLVEVFASRPHLKLVVVGSGDYVPALRRSVKKRGVRAEFTGRLTGHALSRAYANGTIFVFPSETETFGQVVQEAMASGLPVVLTDKGAAHERVRHDETGFVASTTEEFGEAVDRLAADAGLRKRMSLAARAEAERKSWGQVTSRLLGDLYGRAREIHAGRRLRGRS